MTYSSSMDEGCKNKQCPGKSTRIRLNINRRRGLICFICGIIYGMAHHRATVLHTNVIQQQMIFREFTLIKFCLSALSTSMFAMSLMAMIPQTSRMFNMATNHYFNQLSERTIEKRCVGDALTGVGMAMAGSCPVVVFAQLGMRLPSSGYILLGELSAIIIICLLKPEIDSYLKPAIVESKNPWSRSPYFMLSLPIVAMFGILVCAFETLLPFDVDSSVTPLTNKGFISSYPWPPYLCGIVYGILQIPMIVSIQKTLSGSDGLEIVASQILRRGSRKDVSLDREQQALSDGLFQLLFVGGAMSGGFWSAYQSQSLGTGLGVQPMLAFVGGFLMTVGSKIGGGSVSCHGLTGMGLLSIQSFLSIVLTFAICSITTFILHLSGLLLIT